MTLFETPSVLATVAIPLGLGMIGLISARHAAWAAWAFGALLAAGMIAALSNLRVWSSAPPAADAPIEFAWLRAGAWAVGLVAVVLGRVLSRRSAPAA